MSKESDIKELIKVAEDWTEAIRRDPGDITAYMLRGTAYRRQGKHAEAIADFTEVIRLDPDLAMAYNNRGRAYLRQGKYAEAAADYAKAKKLHA